MKRNTYKQEMLVHVYLKKVTQSRDKSFGGLFKEKRGGAKCEKDNRKNY